MSGPSVEEIVAALEENISLGGGMTSTVTECIRALIADWRKRGEALEEARLQLREYNGSWLDADLTPPQPPWA